MCGGAEHELIAVFTRSPKFENSFGIEKYYRELWRCLGCGLYSNQHQLDLSHIYFGSYGEAAYVNASGVSRYDSIMSLPPEKSDNRMRVRRVIDYMDTHHKDMDRTVLDIGSGMAVFPAVMRENGWAVTAIDPSPVNAAHAREVAQVEAIEAAYPDVALEKKYTLVTFNKVLEHIKDATAFLASAKCHLVAGGIVYIELPDGECAIEAGSTRQEFFLEHYYAFSVSSLKSLAINAGFEPREIIRLRDPSGKYTLAAFLAPNAPSPFE